MLCDSWDTERKEAIHHSEDLHRGEPIMPVEIDRTCFGSLAGDRLRPNQRVDSPGLYTYTSSFLGDEGDLGPR